jgi:hypothetical protein
MPQISRLFWTESIPTRPTKLDQGFPAHAEAPEGVRVHCNTLVAVQGRLRSAQSAQQRPKPNCHARLFNWRCSLPSMPTSQYAANSWNFPIARPGLLKCASKSWFSSVRILGTDDHDPPKFLVGSGIKPPRKALRDGGAPLRQPVTGSAAQQRVGRWSTRTWSTKLAPDWHQLMPESKKVSRR